MFDRIAETYDQLNGLITFGMDKTWRKRVAKMIAANDPKTIPGTHVLRIVIFTFLSFT